MKSYFSLGLILLSLVGLSLLSSCKKDEEEETAYSFSGEIVLDIPAYVKVGETAVFRQYGLYKTDGSTDIGWYWNVADIDSSNDTTRVEGDPETVTGYRDFTCPDTLGTFTVTCGAFADDYYATTRSTEFTSVKEGLNTGTITDFDMFEDDATLTDPRDGKTYLCRKVGELYWMRQNLAYEELGVSMEDLSSTTNIFGRFYSWAELPDVCPEGWRVPSDEDWVALAGDGVNTVYEPYTVFKDAAGRLMVNARFNGGLLWEFWPKVPITNTTGFAAMPFGIASKSGEGQYQFQGLDYYAAYWTSSTYEGDPVYRYIFEQDNDVFLSRVGKEDILLPVRCVRGE